MRVSVAGPLFVVVILNGFAVCNPLRFELFLAVLEVDQLAMLRLDAVLGSLDVLQRLFAGLLALMLALDSFLDRRGYHDALLFANL